MNCMMSFLFFCLLLNQVVPIEDEREWLLTAHLMSEFNEARGELKDIIVCNTPKVCFIRV